MKTTLTYCKTAALVIALVLSGCSRSPEAIKARHLAQGKKLLQKNDFSRAILEFKSAVKAAPQDAESYYQLGLAFSASTDLQSAVYAYQRATDLNPKHVEAQTRLAQLMAMGGDEPVLKDAQQRLARVMAGSHATPELTNILAFTQLRLGETDAAIKNLEGTLANSPAEFRASALLAGAKIYQKDFAGAEEVLRKASSSAPKSAEARVMLGRFYWSQHRLAEAEEQFKKALEISPQASSVLADLGNLQRSAGRKQDAEQSFRLLANLKDKQAHTELGLYLFEEGRRDDAVRELERVVREHPDNHGARTRLVAAYNAVNKTGDAQSLLDGALKKNPKDTDALVQRAELAIAAAKYQQAESDLNQVLRMQPTSADVHYQLAKLHKTRGETLTYRQELAEALRLNPNQLDIRLELARSLTAANNSKSAIDLLNETPEPARSSAAVLVQRNWALWEAGDMKEMRKQLDSALAREKSPDLLVQDGLWKLKTGDFAGARSSVEKALKLDPADLRALTTLADAYTGQRERKAGISKVREYAAQQPRSAPVQEFLGLLQWANGDRVAARAAFEQAKSADPGLVSTDLRLAQMDVLDKKWDDASHRLESILSRGKNNTLARLWLANIEELQGKHASALDNLRKVVQAEPENALALNNLAFLLSEQAGKADEALQYAEKAQEIAPENAEYADTLGWILYRKGLYPLSLKHLERAASQKGSAVWNYHLAMAYAKNGDSQRGRTTLDAALRRNPNLPEAKMAQEVFESRR